MIPSWISVLLSHGTAGQGEEHVLQVGGGDLHVAHGDAGGLQRLDDPLGEAGVGRVEAHLAVADPQVRDAVDAVERLDGHGPGGPQLDLGPASVDRKSVV